MLTVEVTAPCYPTENREKVKRAMLNIFPDLEIEERSGRIDGKTDSIENLAYLLRKERIRDAARAHLLSCCEQNELAFSLNKQAAYMGRLNFAEKHPLGNIEVRISGEDPKQIVALLTMKRLPSYEEE